MGLRRVSAVEPAFEVFPTDDGDEPGSAPSPVGRVCLGCGGSGHGGDGCEHEELARFHAPSRAVSEAVQLLRLAAAEHRAASRALRALAINEESGGRAELESAPRRPVAVAGADSMPPPEPCPRCAEHDAEIVTTGGTAARSAKRRARKTPVGQHALPFVASDPPSDVAGPGG